VQLDEGRAIARASNEHEESENTRRFVESIRATRRAIAEQPR
jgi:hypothetical protein